MNDTAIKQTRAGFRYDDTLASRFKWNGIARLWERDHIKKDTSQGESEYWALKDEYGARMVCFDEALANSLVIGEIYELWGEIKIGKGATFLNLKKAKIFNGKEYAIKE